ncbi:MAG: hypothetical protein IPJ04_17345 [Candidatus Eisenbacteria bacterium]|nr:hypothetical protein [Candidatus Eisenbacteria bacterium]
MVRPRVLEQAVANLLSNALKFTPSGGHVRLTGGVEGGGEEARWTFAVSDDGPGIAPDEQARLFERFYQASGARDVARPGTGIGLSLTRDIVELHGGTIALASAPGEGSTFTVRLPLGRAHLSDAQIARGGDAAALAPAVRARRGCSPTRRARAKPPPRRPIRPRPWPMRRRCSWSRTTPTCARTCGAISRRTIA